MASYTPNINLKKPTTDEYYNVLDENQNKDKIDTAIGTLNSQLAGFVLVYKGSLAANASANITASGAHNIYFVAYGNWNTSRLFAVYPAQGDQPRVKPISWYANTDTDSTLDSYASIAAYGNNGFTITNVASYQMPLTVYAFVKTN